MAELNGSSERASTPDSSCPAKASGTLLSSVDQHGPVLPKDSSHHDGPLMPGDQLDDYEVIAFLGCGGTGGVYRARHRRLDREFALKVISSSYISPVAVRRFEREMKAV